jgi:hypothetical protein
MYATVQDLRDEGVVNGSDTRLTALLEEASAIIDRVTGWFFEPRMRTYLLDGRGSATLEPPVPLIRLDRLRVGGADVDVRSVIVQGAPVEPGFSAPRIALPGGIFPRGYGNVEVVGLWGFTEPDGTAAGRVPLEIRRATMMLAMRMLLPLAAAAGGGGGGGGGPPAWRIIEERTRDQTIRYAPPGGASAAGVSATPRTGDTAVEEILVRYLRPMGLGAA